MINELNIWKKKHRDRTDFGPFKNRPHPIKKMKYPNKTVYYCVRCRVYFTDQKSNKIKPKKQKVWKKDPTKKTEFQIWTAKLDRLWAHFIKERAGRRSEVNGRGPHTLDFLHAHHIHGKSTLALRYDLKNGICCTGEEHSTRAHGPADEQKIFKEIAIDKRNVDNHLISEEHDCGGDFEEIEAYLKDNIKRLKTFEKFVEETDVYFP